MAKEKAARQEAKEMISRLLQDGFVDTFRMSRTQKEALLDELSASLPVTKTVRWDEKVAGQLVLKERELPRHGEHGCFVHVIRVSYEGGTKGFVEEVRRIASLQGEVCASTHGPYFTRRGADWVALVFRGKARAIWDRDVYSVLDAAGRREATRPEGGPGAHLTWDEAWIVPGEMELVGVVSNDYHCDWAPAALEAGIPAACFWEREEAVHAHCTAEDLAEILDEHAAASSTGEWVPWWAWVD